MIVLVAMVVSAVIGMTMSLRVLRKARGPTKCERSRRSEDADGIERDESHRHPDTHRSREAGQHAFTYT
jgi:hypothetical protein